MKVAIIGGHLTPALAVIKALPQQTGIIYIGRKYALEGDRAISLEYQAITALQIPFISFTSARFQRTLTKHTIPSLARMPKGVMQAFRLLKNHKPDVILSFGGYLSIPLCFAGYLLKIPIVIHEQTMKAGLSNKIVSFFAKKVCISWESSQKFFPKNKIVLTGNPIIHGAPSQDIEKYKKLHSDLPLLVIVGGSQGSHAINMLIESILPKLLEKFQIIHQTGDAKEFGDFERLQKQKSYFSENLQERYGITKFIQPVDVEYIYKEADLVVSRAGINTVLTLLLVNKPTLLIPLPHGQKNEQLTNALYFKECGLGEVVKQKSLTSEKLYEKIIQMYNNKNNYTNIQYTFLTKLHGNAAKKIAEILLYVQESAESKK